MKNQVQFLLILMIISVVACEQYSTTEQLDNNTEQINNIEHLRCYAEFFAGSTDCGANYFETLDKYGLQGDTRKFDLNGDGLPEISFKGDWGGSRFEEHLSSQTNWYQNVDVLLNERCSICLNDSLEADTIQYGELFNEKENWSMDIKEFRVSAYKEVTYFNNEEGYWDVKYSSGSFYNVDNKYLLARYAFEKDTILAWFNINCGVRGGFSISEYAFLVQ